MGAAARIRTGGAGLAGRHARLHPLAREPLSGALFLLAFSLLILLGVLLRFPLHRWPGALLWFLGTAPRLAACGAAPGLVLALLYPRTRRLGWPGDALVIAACVQAFVVAVVLLHPGTAAPDVNPLDAGFWATTLLASAGMGFANTGLPLLLDRIGRPPARPDPDAAPPPAG